MDPTEESQREPPPTPTSNECPGKTDDPDRNADQNADTILKEHHVTMPSAPKTGDHNATPTDQVSEPGTNDPGLESTGNKSSADQTGSLPPIKMEVNHGADEVDRDDSGQVTVEPDINQGEIESGSN